MANAFLAYRRSAVLTDGRLLRSLPARAGIRMEAGLACHPRSVRGDGTAYPGQLNENVKLSTPPSIGLRLYLNDLSVRAGVGKPIERSESVKAIPVPELKFAHERPPGAADMELTPGYSCRSASTFPVLLMKHMRDLPG